MERVWDWIFSDNSFEGGEVSNFPQAEYNKLKYKKIGLCEILKKFGDNAYQIELPEGIDISHIVNVPDLYQYQEGDEAEVNEEDGIANSMEETTVQI